MRVVFKWKSFPRHGARDHGFSLVELVLVLMGGLALMAAGAPLVGTIWNDYRLVLAAQSITSQMQFARMKAVTSNESFRVRFPSGQRTYVVETSTGAALAGPFVLPRGVVWNADDTGSAITFPGNYVEFLPIGNTPSTGNGSPGRVKIINASGIRIDIVVSAGGGVRQTPSYHAPPAPF